MGKSNSPQPESFLPLTSANFEIMLSLWDGDLHGYGIMQVVREATEGKTLLLPGTLYKMLTRLQELELVEESGRRPDPGLDDERRRYYRLTSLGRRVLKAEAQRLAGRVQAACEKRLIRYPERT